MPGRTAEASDVVEHVCLRLSRIHPVRLSITHKWFSGEFCAKLDVHEPRPTSPHDHGAGRRIVPSTEVAAEASDFDQIR